MSYTLRQLRGYLSASTALEIDDTLARASAHRAAQISAEDWRKWQRALEADKRRLTDG
jgi:hypothetical protein